MLNNSSKLHVIATITFDIYIKYMWLSAWDKGYIARRDV